MGSDERLETLLGAARKGSFATVADGLAVVGELIDHAAALSNDDGLRVAIECGGTLLDHSPSAEERALIEYFLANAWADRRAIRMSGTRGDWEWEAPETAHGLVLLRHAIRGPGFEQLPKVRRCQILTNLGNLFNSLGRFVEALEYWDRALMIDASFGMALGNRGMGRYHYGRYTGQRLSQITFFRSAHPDLVTAGRFSLEDDALAAIEAIRKEIERLVPAELLNAPVEPATTEELGQTPEEVRYRRWCIARRLILNPMNDLGALHEGVHDAFTVASITVPIGHGPYRHAFVDQMKQEFVSARFLLYSGLTEKGTHFADTGVRLSNTLDYPCYSLRIEEVKVAFRTLYSLLDKIAFFLNEYLELGIPEIRVSARSVWFKNGKRAEGLRPQFVDRQNWGFRGLFWLMRDVFEPEEGFRDALEEDARELSSLRHALEHRCLRVLEGIPGNGLVDPLSMTVSRRALETKVLRLAKLVRAAWIYLVCGVQDQEHRQEHGRQRPLAQLPLDKWEDEWKR